MVAQLNLLSPPRDCIYASLKYICSESAVYEYCRILTLTPPKVSIYLLKRFREKFTFFLISVDRHIFFNFIVE